MGAASAVTRRDAVRGALCAGSSLLLARRGTAAHTDTARGATLSALKTTEVASGIFVRRGVDEDASRANDNAIANIGFIVGNDAVAVIDPGGSLRDGYRLRASIRRVTSLPIRFVVMSHGHPDHIFGAGAFQQDRPSFLGHSRLPQTLATRGEYYRQGLDGILGAGNAGPVVSATQLVADRARIDLGGRILELRAHGVAHSDCDLTTLDLRTATLLAGDLLFVGRLPSLDGSLKGWLQELASLQSVQARRAVPGHGPTSVDWPGGSKDLERYLLTLQRETRQALNRGVEIDAATHTVAQSERKRWQLFDDYNGHNVTRAFKEIEWE